MVLFSASNKGRLLELGVMAAVLELKHTEVMAVTFKLLGVLRMLIDGQGMQCSTNWVHHILRSISCVQILCLDAVFFSDW